MVRAFQGYPGVWFYCSVFSTFYSWKLWSDPWTWERGDLFREQDEPGSVNSVTGGIKALPMVSTYACRLGVYLAETAGILL